MQNNNFIVILFVLFNCNIVFSAEYDELRARALLECDKINPKEYQTGLIMNPEGYRSYYVRSACFQRAAIKFRDAEICQQVKKRFALFSSSWGYSKKNCEQLVNDGRESDRNHLLKIKNEFLAQGPVQLVDFRIEQNGNGRDYDIIPTFSEGYVHAYMLQFNIIDISNNNNSALLDSSGFYLTGPENNIRLYVPRKEIQQRFANFMPGKTYRVRATLILSVGNGTQSGRWSEEFIDSVFPVLERTQHLEKETGF